MYDLTFKKRKECAVLSKKILLGLFISEETLDPVDSLHKEVVCQTHTYKYHKRLIKVKNTILTFCIYVEMVIIMTSTIRRAGLIAFVTMCKNSLDFTEAEAYGLLIKLNRFILNSCIILVINCFRFYFNVHVISFLQISIVVSNQVYLVILLAV